VLIARILVRIGRRDRLPNEKFALASLSAFPHLKAWDRLPMLRLQGRDEQREYASRRFVVRSCRRRIQDAPAGFASLLALRFGTI